MPDATVIETPAVNAPEQPPVDGGQPAELPTDAPEAGQGNPAEEPIHTELAPEAPPDNVNKRFSALTRERDEARREASDANRRLHEAWDALKTMGTKPAETLPVAEEHEPAEPQFESPEQYQRDMAEYIRKMTEYNARTVIKATLAEQEKTRKEDELRNQQAAIQQAWQQRRQKAVSEMPDYMDVAENPNVPITQAMASVITTEEAGPKLAYYLGQHPEEAARISQLNPFAQIVELGALRERILTPQKPTTSRAPAPIRPITGAATPASKSMDDMSMDEYAAARRRH